MPPVVDMKNCIFCKTCAEICPLDVIKVNSSKNEVEIRYPNECWHCRACVIDCPVDAIHMRYPLSHFMLHQEIEGRDEKKEVEE